MPGKPVSALLFAALTAAAVSAGDPGQSLAEEQALVAYYPLDEGDGRAVKDRSGRGNEGKVLGAQWRKSDAGNTLFFDGIDDLVDCGSPPELDLRGPLTLSAWILPADVPAGEVGVVGKNFGSYLLTYYRDRCGYGYIGEGGNHVKSRLWTRTWNHVAFTFDGDRLRLYRNGEPIHEATSKQSTVPAAGNFVLGCVDGSAGGSQRSGFFRGKIAEVRVYARALSPHELREQFLTDGRRRFSGKPADLAAMDAVCEIKAGSTSVRAGRSGMLQVDLAGKPLFLQSAFSYPGQRIGHNPLGPDRGDAEPGWEPEIRSVGEDALSISAQGEFYELTRNVRLRGRRIEIEDTLANRSREAVGVVVENRLTAAGIFDHVHLGYGSEEPVIFLSTPQYDLGLVVEDDVARAQFEPSALLNRAGFAISHFALDAGKSHTFRWAIYPLEPAGDRFALVNRVREDWGVNHTILGPCSFFDVTTGLIRDPAALKQYLTRRKLAIAMLSPWLDYDPGSMSYTMPRDEYKAMMIQARDALKAADPEIKVIGSIETDWVAIYPDRIAGGDRLPSFQGGGSGQVHTTPEQTEILRKANLPWADSMKTNLDGSLQLELYGRGGKPQIALGVYPAEGNHQAEFLMDQARFLVEEVGLDGFYIDEFSLFWVRSYEKWDGVSVDIDPTTGRIARKYTDASLAGIRPRLDLCRYAVDRSLVMVANTYATTLAEARLPVMRFAETWSRLDPRALPSSGKPPFMPDLARSQLGTMIGLGLDNPGSQPSEARRLMRGLIAYLRHAMVYYHYVYPDLPEEGEGSGDYGPINHMFPITPVRLFEGGIAGKERTVTCVSGRYDWPRPDKPVVLVFDPSGRQKDGDVRIERVEQGWAVDLQLEDWNEIAVVQPGDGSATSAQSQP